MGTILGARREFESAHGMFLEAVENDNPDADVMYIAGRALLSLARKIRVNTPGAEESELQVADKAIESAKEIFGKFARPKGGARDRILSDRKLRMFVASDMGIEFLEWFAKTESQFAEKEGLTKKR